MQYLNRFELIDKHYGMDPSTAKAWRARPEANDGAGSDRKSKKMPLGPNIRKHLLPPNQNLTHEERLTALDLKAQLSLNPNELCQDFHVFRQHELTNRKTQAHKQYQVRLPQADEQERLVKRKKFILSCLEPKEVPNNSLPGTR